MSDPTSSRPSTGAQILVFVAIALASLSNYYVYDSIGPVAELLTRQLGFSDAQIGTLNGIYSLPNVFLVLVGGILCDRFGARTIALLTTLICLLGACVTALGEQFHVMALGRLLFGLGAETMIVAFLVALAQWYSGRHLALLLALNVSVSRLGSYLADVSPTFAKPLYDQGWQSPLWLATAVALIGLIGGMMYWLLDRRQASYDGLAVAAPSERFEWRQLLRFRREYWLVVGLCVAFYCVIFPFRSTFAIKYFQHTHGMSLEAAGQLNSYVFLAAAFTTPVFGLLLDRIGRHALLLMLGSLFLPLSFVALATGIGGPALPTIFLGIAFSFVPAVIWPAVPAYVEPVHVGTAFGLMTMLQNIGLVIANVVVGHLNDASGASADNPAGYASMLWFFGLLSTLGFCFAVLLWRHARQAATPATVGASVTSS